MSLTEEQQAQHDAQVALETARHNNQLAIIRETTRLDLVRISKEVLVENARVKPVEDREVSEAGIIAFAETLSEYVIAD